MYESIKRKETSRAPFSIGTIVVCGIILFLLVPKHLPKSRSKLPWHSRQHDSQRSWYALRQAWSQPKAED